MGQSKKESFDDIHLDICGPTEHCSIMASHIFICHGSLPRRDNTSESHWHTDNIHSRGADSCGPCNPPSIAYQLVRNVGETCWKRNCPSSQRFLARSWLTIWSTSSMDSTRAKFKNASSQLSTSSNNSNANDEIPFCSSSHFAPRSACKTPTWKHHIQPLHSPSKRAIFYGCIRL